MAFRRDKSGARMLRSSWIIYASAPDQFAAVPQRVTPRRDLPAMDLSCARGLNAGRAPL